MTLVSNDTDGHDDHDEHDDNNDLNTYNFYPKSINYQYPHSNIKSKLAECISVFMNLTGFAPLAVVNISSSYRTAFQLVHCNNCTLQVLSIVFVLYLSAFI